MSDNQGALLADNLSTGWHATEFVITRHMPLDQAAEGYKLFDKKEDGVTKVVLQANG